MNKFDLYILKTIKAGLFFTLITPLLMFSSLLYPFVTSKVFFFRILIEILAGLYLYLAFKYKEYRPRFSWLLAGLLLFSAVLLLSGALGVDWNLSFWGDLERLGGIFTWLHFVAYFVILASVLKEEKDWHWLITSSVIVSAIMTIYGLAQKFSWWGVYNAGTGRIDSTTGNPSYFAAYLFFQIFFVFFLFIKTKKLIWRALLVGLAALQLVNLFYTGTRGAYLGLGAGVLIFVFLYVVFSANRSRRLLLGGGLVFLLALYLGFYLNGEAVVAKFPSLGRIFEISLGDPTVNTRFIAWNAAWRGFLKHPVLGVGPENFSIIFDKYFQPSFYTFTPTQTYFDRAHNTVFDLLVTSGILGLSAYLLIFSVLMFYLVKSFKKQKINLKIFSGAIALLVAYFIQNLFVFDSVNSYIPFILVLALVEHWNFQRGESKDIKKEKISLSFFGQKTVIGIVFALAALVAYLYNLKPLLASQQVKLAEYFVQKENNLVEGVNYYRKALSYQTPLDRDIRTQLSTAVGLNIAKYGKRLTSQEINEIFDLVISEMKKNIAYNPHDNFFNLKLGELYNLWSDYNKKEPKEAEYYLNKAMEASPGRLTGYYVLSQSKLLRKDYDEAIKIARRAVDMNPLFSISYWHLTRAYYVAGRDDEAIKTMKAALLLGYQLTDIKDIEELVSRYYEKGEYKMIITLLRQAVALKPDDAQYYGRLAMAYAAIDDKENARKYIHKVLEIDNMYQAEVNLFLDKLEKGGLKRVF